MFASAQPASLPLAGPPPAFDHRKQLKAITQELVNARYPALAPLVESGTLVAIPRSAAYVERRSDGYQEPDLIFIVGTAHISPQSAADVQAVIAAVRPDSVVVELCKSRAPLMYDPTAYESTGAPASLK